MDQLTHARSRASHVPCPGVWYDSSDVLSYWGTSPGRGRGLFIITRLLRLLLGLRLFGDDTILSLFIICACRAQARDPLLAGRAGANEAARELLTSAGRRGGEAAPESLAGRGGRGGSALGATC